jgi:glycerol-3-phosphate acyltransferase PlsY
MLITWCLIWILFFSFKKDVLPSNIFATFSMPVFAVIIKKLYLSVLPLPLTEISYVYFVIFVVLISSVILIKHKEAFSRLIPTAVKNLNK